MTPDSPAVTVFIAMGSNIEPRPNLARALARLRRLLDVEQVSSVYESAPYGAPGTPRFLNAAVRARTALAPGTLRARLRAIEAELGRRRGRDPNAPRPIDLDIALYGELVIDDPAAGLRIPDPEILERAYLALPLAEVGAELSDPRSGEPLGAIASRFAAAPGGPRRLPEGLEAFDPGRAAP